MNTPASRLIVRRGKTPQPEYSLTDQTVVIGREAINDIMFQELEISRRHASISFAGGQYTIEDLASTNGTFVNGRRISTPTMLSDGDVLDLGDSVSLVFAAVPASDITRAETTSGEISQPPEPGASEPEYAPPQEVPQFSQPTAQTPQPTWQTSQPSYPAPDPTQMAPMPPPAEKRDRRRLYIGCGCLVLLLLAGCVATYAFLDSYQGGDFLYCQTFRPIWEVVFGVSRVAAGC